MAIDPEFQYTRDTIQVLRRRDGCQVIAAEEVGCSPDVDSSTAARGPRMVRGPGVIGWRLVARLLVLVVAVVATLLLCEGGLRVADSSIHRSGEFQPPLTRDPLADGRSMFASGYSGRHVSPEFDVRIRVNELGFREGELDRGHLTERRPFLFVGDSYFWGWGVEKEERVSERFAAALLAAGGEAVPAVNLSMPGWGGRRYSEVTELFGDRLHPRLVIVGLFVGNDFLDDAKAVRESGPRSVGSRLRLRRILRNSALVNLLKRALWSLSDFRRLFNWLEVRNDRIVLYEHEESELQRTLYRPTLEAFDRIAAISRSTATPVFVVLLPDHLQVLEPELFDDYEIGRPQRILTTHLDSLGLPSIDLRMVFAEEPQLEDMYFREDKHWTPRGHDFVAQAILARAVEIAAGPATPGS